MTRIAFLGLGRMGALMAGRLLDADYDLTVWNRTAAAAEPFARVGARVASTPATAAADGQLVITMLADARAVSDVLFGADGSDGAAAALAPGDVLVEMSTIGPDAVAGLRAWLPDGVRLVDAPVLGSLPQASAGELEIFAGGPAGDVAAAREPLDVLGRVRHAGPSGSGAALKVVVNAVTMPSFVLLGEALTLAARLEVDPGAALDALAGPMPLARRVRARLGDAEAPTQFAMALAEKDLGLAIDGGGHGLGVLEAARAQLAAARSAGLGDRDVTAVIDYLRGAHAR